MAYHRLTDPISNSKINIQEKLLECLLKAEAIAQVALSDDFLSYNESTIRCYLWGLSDILTEARDIFERNK